MTIYRIQRLIQKSYYILNKIFTKSTEGFSIKKKGSGPLFLLDI